MKVLKQIAHDTLKKKMPDGTREWSRTSLTMASAWTAALGTYIVDFYLHGFRMDSFTVMVSVALGVKWLDAKSKQIEKS